MHEVDPHWISSKWIQVRIDNYTADVNILNDSVELTCFFFPKPISRLYKSFTYRELGNHKVSRWDTYQLACISNY